MQNIFRFASGPGRFRLGLLAAALAAAPLLAQPSPAPAPPVPPEHGIHIAMPARSFLGVGVTEISADRAKELKLAEERGVEITKVDEGSPAEKAGLKKGDVVLEYQGQRLEGTEQFVRLVRETPPGRTVKMLISRGGSTQTVSAVLGERKGRAISRELRFEMPSRFDVWIPDIPRVTTAWRSGMLGIEAESLEGQLASFFGVKEGVLVRSVVKGSAAEKAGFKAGDVITRVDDREVSNPRELSNVVREKRSKKTFSIRITRDKKEMTLTVSIEEERSEKEGTRPRIRFDAQQL